MSRVQAPAELPVDQAVCVATGASVMVTGLLKAQPSAPKQQQCAAAAAAAKYLLAILVGRGGGRAMIACQHADGSADRCVLPLAQHMSIFVAQQD